MCFYGIVFSKVVSENEIKLTESWRFANPSNPQKKDGEMRVGDLYFTLGIVLDQFLYIHKTELIHYFLLRSHWITQLPNL